LKGFVGWLPEKGRGERVLLDGSCKKKGRNGDKGWIPEKGRGEWAMRGGLLKK